jgi:hypothetical protein
MGRLRAASLVLVALAAGLLLAGCGGSKAELLPGTTADQIISNLDQVRANAEEGNCEGAEAGVAAISTEVDELQKVDTKLKKALEHGALKLSTVVSTCGAAEEEAEEKANEEAEEQEQVESEEAAEEEAFEQEKEQEREEKAKEKAENEAEESGPPTGGEESEVPGEGKGHEKQEEVEPPSEETEEVTPPAEGEGPAGGIGPGASVEGGP